LSAAAYEPMGDQSVLAHCADEAAALSFAAAVRAAKPGWLLDVVSAYAAVAVFFDADRIRYSDAEADLRHILESPRPDRAVVRQSFSIPCCYELQLDLGRVAEFTSMSADEVIRLHSACEYTVYAIGFCPGFPYLGYLPEELCGVPRLPAPRRRVEPGTVGLTGRQTGVYPLERPGGWNLIGRTPLSLVDVADDYFPLRAGDRLQFVRIDEREFERLRGERIPYRQRG
jgi:inhibitor of KinA